MLDKQVNQQKIRRVFSTIYCSPLKSNSLTEIEINYCIFELHLN